MSSEGVSGSPPRMWGKLIGDLNAYAIEDQIQSLRSDGFTDLISDTLGLQSYTYIFDGQSGYLDHALANGSLLSQVAGLTIWHINADEPLVIDYDENFNPAGYYETDPYRSSDHDPVIIGLDLTTSPTVVSMSDAGSSPSSSTLLISALAILLGALTLWAVTYRRRDRIE